MKENVFSPDEMAVIINALIYTHARKQKALKKARDMTSFAGPKRIALLEKQATEALTLLRQISDNTDPGTRDFIYDQLKLALA